MWARRVGQTRVYVVLFVVCTFISLVSSTIHARSISLSLSLSLSRCPLAPPRPARPRFLFPTPTPQMTLVARNIAQAMGGDAEVHYHDGYPATVNHAAQTVKARAVAEAVVGVENVTDACPPTMGAEDFSYLLQERPGCYVWLGQARGGEVGEAGGGQGA